METLFYCPGAIITLEDLIGMFNARGLVSSANNWATDRAIIYQEKVWFHLDQIDVTEFDSFEEPQQRVLKAGGISRVFQFSFRDGSDAEVIPYIRLAIECFGGWMGFDDGLFATRLDAVGVSALGKRPKPPAATPDDLRSSGRDLETETRKETE